MEENDHRIVWIDVETTGLGDHAKILEIGAVITDADLDPLAAAHAVFVHDLSKLKMTEKVWKMHTANGLLDEIRARDEHHTIRYETSRDIPGFGRLPGQFLVQGRAVTVPDFDYQLNCLIKGWSAQGAPLAGSSVAFDRRMMKHAGMAQTLGLLHYRNFDVSVMRSAMRRWCPGLELPPKSDRHRVFDDLAASIASAKMARELLLNDQVEVPITNDLNDLVSEWQHDRPARAPGRLLHQFIGWTWDQYKYWVASSADPANMSDDLKEVADAVDDDGDDHDDPVNVLLLGGGLDNEGIVSVDDIAFDPDFTPADTDGDDQDDLVNADGDDQDIPF